MNKSANNSGPWPKRFFWGTGFLVLAFGIIATVRFRDRLAAESSSPSGQAADVQALDCLEAASPQTTALAGSGLPAHPLANLQTILGAIEAETDPIRREELLQLALSDILPEEMAAVIAALQNAERTGAVTELGVRLMRRWAELDPRAAAAAIGPMAQSELRMESLDQVAIAWADRQLCDAAMWARTLPDAYERNRALSAMAYEVVRTKPAEALGLAVELTPDSKRNRLLNQAAAEWAAREPAEAARWAQQIPDGTIRQKVLAGVAVAWGEQDPAAAAILATTELTGRVEMDAAIQIAQRWVQRDPENAAAWVEQFPEGPAKLAAIESIGSIWSLSDAPRAQQWKSSQTLAP